MEADDRAEVLMDYIRNIRFDDESGQTFSFDGSSGDVPVDILRIQQGQYVKVNIIMRTLSIAF